MTDEYPLQATQWVLSVFSAILLIFIAIVALSGNRKTST
jgi:hypothetical protein